MHQGRDLELLEQDSEVKEARVHPDFRSLMLLHPPENIALFLLWGLL